MPARNPHEADDDFIIMSNAPSRPIAQFKDLDTFPPPETPRCPSEYSEWRGTSRGSDEVEFLDARTAVPLRDMRGDHVAAPLAAAAKSRSGR